METIHQSPHLPHRSPPLYLVFVYTFLCDIWSICLQCVCCLLHVCVSHDSLSNGINEPINGFGCSANKCTHLIAHSMRTLRMWLSASFRILLLYTFNFPRVFFIDPGVFILFFIFFLCAPTLILSTLCQYINYDNLRIYYTWFVFTIFFLVLVLAFPVSFVECARLSFYRILQCHHVQWNLQRNVLRRHEGRECEWEGLCVGCK